MEYIPSAQAQEGFEYQASITGQTVKEIITARAEEHGISYWHDKQRAADREVIIKVTTTDPRTKARYAEAIAKVDEEIAVEVGAAQNAEAPI